MGKAIADYEKDVREGNWEKFTSLEDVKKELGINVDEVLESVIKYSDNYTVYPGPEIEEHYVRTHTVTVDQEDIGTIVRDLRRRFDLDKSDVAPSGPDFYPFISFMAYYKMKVGYRKLYQKEYAHLLFDSMVPELTVLRSREQIKLVRNLENYRKSLIDNNIPFDEE